MRFAIALVVALVAFIGFAWWAIDRRDDAEDACARNDGVPVKSHLGDLVCIKRDALIPERDWKPS